MIFLFPPLIVFLYCLVVLPFSGVLSDLQIFSLFGHVSVIRAKTILVLRMDLIHSRNIVTVLTLFFRWWYFLKNIFLTTMYMTVVMVASRMSAVSNLGLVRVSN